MSVGHNREPFKMAEANEMHVEPTFKDTWRSEGYIEDYQQQQMQFGMQTRANPRNLRVLPFPHGKGHF